MIDPRLDTVRCCATCRNFEGQDLKVYKKGVCTAETGRDNPYEKLVWTGTLCYRYVGRGLNNVTK